MDLKTLHEKSLTLEELYILYSKLPYFRFIEVGDVIKLLEEDKLLKEDLK